MPEHESAAEQDQRLHRTVARDPRTGQDHRVRRGLQHVGRAMDLLGRGSRIARIYGILNGTCNFILGQMKAYVVRHMDDPEIQKRIGLMLKDEGELPPAGELGRQAGRDDHGVDYVDHTVRRQDVGGDNGGAAIERQLSVLQRERDRLALEGLDGAVLLCDWDRLSALDVAGS